MSTGHATSPGPAEAGQLIAALFPTVPPGEWVQIWGIHHHRTHPLTGHALTTKRAYRSPDEIDWQHVARRHAEGFDIYVAGASFTTPRSRRKEAAGHLYALWAELDGNPDVLLPAARDALPPDRWPALVVLSGHGLHLWFPLREPVPIQGRIRELEGSLRGLGHAVGGDHVHDVTRLLRVPTFFNTKDLTDVRPVRLVECHPDRRFQLEDFRLYYAPGPQRGSMEGPPPRIAEALRRDPHLQAAFRGEITPPGGSTGSHRDLVLAHAARKAGLLEGDAAWLVDHAVYEKRNPRTAAYTTRTVRKAFRTPTPRTPPKNRGAFGIIPALVVVDGIWAQLSPKAARLFPVLAVRSVWNRERTQGIVRDSRLRLAALAGLNAETVGLALKELADMGLVRLRRWREGTLIYLSRTPTSTESSSVQVTPLEEAAIPGGMTEASWEENR